MRGRKAPQPCLAPRSRRITGCQQRDHLKIAAGAMQPLDVWGLDAWTHRVGEALTECPIARFEPQIRQYSYDKTTAYIARMFRRHITEMRDSGEDFYRTCEAIWTDDDEAQRTH